MVRIWGVRILRMKRYAPKTTFLMARLMKVKISWNQSSFDAYFPVIGVVPCLLKVVLTLDVYDSHEQSDYWYIFRRENPLIQFQGRQFKGIPRYYIMSLGVCSLQVCANRECSKFRKHLCSGNMPVLTKKGWTGPESLNIRLCFVGIIRQYYSQF